MTRRMSSTTAWDWIVFKSVANKADEIGKSADNRIGGKRCDMMEWMHFHRTLFGKLVLSFGVLIVATITLIGVFSFRASEQIIEKQILESHQNTLEQINKNISFILDQVVVSVNIYNLNADLESMLQTRSLDPQQQLKNREQVERKIVTNSIIFSNIQMNTILIGLNDVVYSQNPTWLTGSSDLEAFPWYSRVKEQPERLHWLPTHASFAAQQEGKPVFTAVKMLQSQYVTRNYGILLLSIPESELFAIYSESLNDRSAMDGNAIFIMDSEGRVISHSDRSLVGTRIRDEALLAFINENDPGRIHWSKTQAVISSRIPKTDWFVMKSIQRVGLFQDIRNLQAKIALMSLLGLLVTLIIAVLLSKVLSAPLVKLSARVRTYIAQSGMPHQKEASQNEVHMLNHGYEEMVAKLESTIMDLIANQESRRKAELAALQMQINPHFLYNTLNSIKCLVWTQKSHLIEPMINALVHLLEKTIHRSGEWISLTEELECVQNYVFIQQIRLDTVIPLHLHVDNDIKKYKIPKLLLQPVVENAIFHGFEETLEGFVISVHCANMGDHIKIEVIDNGLGMEPQTLKQLLLGLESKQSEQFTGIGVYNVDERLRMNFGAQYGMNIQSEWGKGTRVTIMLPRGEEHKRDEAH